MSKRTFLCFLALIYIFSFTVCQISNDATPIISLNGSNSNGSIIETNLFSQTLNRFVTIKNEYVTNNIGNSYFSSILFEALKFDDANPNAITSNQPVINHLIFTYEIVIAVKSSELNLNQSYNIELKINLETLGVASTKTVVWNNNLELIAKNMKYSQYPEVDNETSLLWKKDLFELDSLDTKITSIEINKITGMNFFIFSFEIEEYPCHPSCSVCDTSSSDPISNKYNCLQCRHSSISSILTETYNGKNYNICKFNDNLQGNNYLQYTNGTTYLLKDLYYYDLNLPNQFKVTSSIVSSSMPFNNSYKFIKIFPSDNSDSPSNNFTYLNFQKYSYINLIAPNRQVSCSSTYYIDSSYKCSSLSYLCNGTVLPKVKLNSINISFNTEERKEFFKSFQNQNSEITRLTITGNIDQMPSNYYDYFYRVYISKNTVTTETEIRANKTLLVIKGIHVSIYLYLTEESIAEYCTFISSSGYYSCYVVLEVVDYCNNYNRLGISAKNILIGINSTSTKISLNTSPWILGQNIQFEVESCVKLSQCSVNWNYSTTIQLLQDPEQIILSTIELTLGKYFQISSSILGNSSSSTNVTHELVSLKFIVTNSSLNPYLTEDISFTRFPVGSAAAKYTETSYYRFRLFLSNSMLEAINPYNGMNLYIEPVVKINNAVRRELMEVRLLKNDVYEIAQTTRAGITISDIQLNKAKELIKQGKDPYSFDYSKLTLGKKISTWKIIVGIAVPIIFSLLIIIIFLTMRRNKKFSPDNKITEVKPENFMAIPSSNPTVTDRVKENSLNQRDIEINMGKN